MNSDNSLIFACENLSIVFDERALFEPLTVSVQAGKVTHIEGKNGIGKTSLLRLLGSEDIKFSGSILSKPSPAEIFYLPQLQSLQSHLPFTLEEVAVLIGNGLISKSFIARDMAKISKMFPQFFSEIQRNKVWNKASGGERMRALLAGAMACRSCRVLLLDEPLNHLDVHSILEVQHSLLQYLRNEGKDLSVFIVSHEPLEALSEGLGGRYQALTLANSEVKLRELK